MTTETGPLASMRGERWTLRPRLPRVSLLMLALLVLTGCAGGAGSDSSETTPPGNTGGETNQPPTNDDNGESPQGGEDLGAIRVVVSAPESMDYLAASFGLELGVWERAGLSVETIEGGEVPQIMAAGEADIGLSGGPGTGAAVVKGLLPAKLVAAITPSLTSAVMAVSIDSEVQTINDLEGATIGISRPGSTTDFVVELIAESQGWETGTDVHKAPIGGINEMVGALQSGAIDGFVWSPEPIYALEEEGEARSLGTLESLGIESQVVSGAAWATEAIIGERPEAVQAYLDGYFETVQYMKDHRDEVVDFVTAEFGLSDFVAGKAFDEFVATEALSSDGQFRQGTIDAMADAIQILDEEIEDTPDMSVILDDRFVPAG